ncbi:MAG: hypothetical protein JNM84_00765 [Planctomycetes bacterium]|nr:hypothetical protein [Planctomycetota bacterium]
MTIDDGTPADDTPVETSAGDAVRGAAPSASEVGTSSPRDEAQFGEPPAPSEAAARIELRALDEADRMWSALEGDLAADELARFEDRVARDAALRRRVREARALDRILPLYAAPDVRPDFARRTLAHLEAEGVLQSAWYARRISLPLPLAAALLLAASLLAAWFLTRGDRGEARARTELSLDAGTPERRIDPAPEEKPSRRSFGPRIVIGAAGSAAAFFDIEAEDELFPIEASPIDAPSTGAASETSETIGSGSGENAPQAGRDARESAPAKTSDGERDR